MSMGVRTGDRDESATEIVAGPLVEGQEVVVGANIQRSGTSILGFRFGF